MRLLDLGGTACYESPDAVGISLDGTSSDDEVTPRVIGDYNRAPFPNNTFDEALGSCYLEEDVDLNELYRVMKPGATIRLGSCMWMYASRPTVYRHIRKAGFKILEFPRWVREDDYSYPDGPLVIQKPE